MVFPRILNPTKRANGQARKGIKTHFNHCSKVSKETQTFIDETRNKVIKDIGVQTQFEDIHYLNPIKNSLLSSQNHSPKSHLSNTHIFSKRNQ